IFGEEYLSFQKYLIPNSFTYIKILVKEGWIDRETGKRKDPNMTFVEFKMLQDVFQLFAKKINILLDVKDLNANFIENLSKVFQENRGDNPVTFDVLELEKVKIEKPTQDVLKILEKVQEPILFDTIDVDDDAEVVFTEEVFEDDEPIILPPVIETAVEETKVVTRLWMQSRKLKLKISNELLIELERLQVDFKLN
ncbi:MAG: DNA polymerase III subunit alpha, partial [Flavobacterium sp.]|nr:DNA polymerase III subunit alpha [Flavobacterium sp.]